MFIQFILQSIPMIITGAALIYLSDPIANFFRDTVSTSLIRGMDNPWTLKALGWMFIIFGPVYVIATLALSSMAATN